MSLRLYYDQPSLTEFDATVSDIRELSRTGGESVWQIALDRTAFYPTSGGQPFDTGVLSATAQSGAKLDVPVAEVEEDEQGTVWHTTMKPLSAGTRVHGTVERGRRRDHMQQHTGQHLLSAVFARRLHAPTVSFHLGDMTSTIDLAIEKLAERELEQVEIEVNEIIAEDRPVSIRTVPRQEAESLLAAGSLRKLPEREGSIRLIEIDGVDLNACGGTHVSSTGQIGGLLVRGMERVRQGVRVEFVCGLRTVLTARADLSALSRAAIALSSARLHVPEAVERLAAEVKSSGKERQHLREELSNYHAARLIVEQPIEDELRLVRRSFADRDAAYIKLLASRLTASAPQTLALLAASQAEPASIIMARSADLDVDCGTLVREALAAYGLRGGGSPSMAQGQLPRAKVEALFDTLEAAARKR